MVAWWPQGDCDGELCEPLGVLHVFELDADVLQQGFGLRRAQLSALLLPALARHGRAQKWCSKVSARWTR
eukprot:1177760-Prorocentrum_minimum.AAC.2